MQNYFYHKRGHQPPQLAAIPAPPRRRLRKRAVVFFACALALIAGVTAAILLLEEPEIPGQTDAPELPPFSMEDIWEQPDETATTVERAPLGDGTTVTIVPIPEGEPLSFQEIYRQNIGSIVSVWGQRDGGSTLGTGVIFTEDGYVITNAHVIEGCAGVTVILADETAYDALLVGMDEETDLAVLKIDAAGLAPAVFGDSDALQVGDVALAIGNPLGEELKGTMTDGIISAINRDVQVDGYTMTLIQTTAALNSGNSGGALINAYGQVVGITNMKIQSYYNTIEGLGFAIPTTTVKQVADELIARGHVAGRPAIGITVSPLTEEAARAAGCPAGLRVEEVRGNSDAQREGIRAGDVVLEANGVPMTTTEDLLTVRNELAVGDTIRLYLWRNGEYLTVDVELVEQYLLTS